MHEFTQWQRCVVEEKVSLDNKIFRLGEFIDKENALGAESTIKYVDHALLESQLKVMREYSSILNSRIKNF